ncbi:MAG: dipicolinate synthase subunit B [Lachnospiraceae bacterium]|nr:dipicolinate synthase subunit B [Lachnospiraceae bacterium]MBQ9608750.1 dipicolinate synthase subunit B [Lachnospiraceae bacterium]
MKLSECNIGFAITGSFCTFDKIKSQIKVLKDEGADITPIFSFNTYNMDTRFTKAKDFIDEIKQITGKEGMSTIQQAEAVGPNKLFDVLVIAPCTGNTAAKLANGITDTPVLMAAKAHLRNNLPLIISISTNDALGINLQNIGKLMVMKNIFFVPFGQDDYIKKPNSMIADVSKIGDTIEAAMNNRQIQPVITN